jgi:cation-transporting P-type ATPase E
VILVNSAVGIIQELRAKRTLDGLALLEQAPVRVRRDGADTDVAPDDVVIDDVVLLAAGAKVPVDGDLLNTDGLEVDESLLTGEADPVSKRPGDPLLSGSFVVAGAGAFVATNVGPDAYANRLVSAARRFELARSELMTGINRILRWITWVIVPVGLLLVISQLRGTRSLAEATVGSVAGIVPMVPEVLVLLTSVAFAVGVVRLGRRRCLVQELPALEVLARVDLLCLDKTGTLTAPEMDLAEVRIADPPSGEQARQALSALAGPDPAPNATMRAIAMAGNLTEDWSPTATVPFSSARKHNAAQFDGRGGWVLGAADVILPAGDPQRGQADSPGASGLRVMALGRLTGDELLADRPLGPVHPVALLVPRQRLRPRTNGARGADGQIQRGFGMLEAL